METLLSMSRWLRTILDAAELMPDFASARGIFCFVAWVATLLALGMMVISFIADLGDGDVDVAHGGDVGVFSVRALIGFLLGFGWGGYMAVQSGVGMWGAVLIGFALGFVMFFVIAAVMRLIYGLKSDGSRDFAQSSMVGMVGTVYVTVPPFGEMGGQVQVSRAGSQLITMPAVQQGDKPLPAQTPVKVIEATPHLLTVTRLNDVP